MGIFRSVVVELDFWLRHGDFFISPLHVHTHIQTQNSVARAREYSLGNGYFFAVPTTIVLYQDPRVAHLCNGWRHRNVAVEAIFDRERTNIVHLFSFEIGVQ